MENKNIVNDWIYKKMYDQNKKPDFKEPLKCQIVITEVKKKVLSQ